MPVSRFLIPLVSTVWIFSVMGGMGMHVLAEQPTEVQAVRRQFSTLEEVTAVQVQEEGSTVRFLPGEGEEVCVRYADTTAEALYEIQVENGTLVVQKLKAPPPKVVTINGTIMQFEVDSAYDLEIVLPQRQYKSIVVENPSGGNVEMDSITAKEICTELKNGSSVFSKTQSDRIKSEIENGSVVFEHPTSSQYDCTVKNGEIKGDVVGRYEDYTVKARVKNGSCMLKSRLDAANQHAMNLYVENGRIEVQFFYLWQLFQSSFVKSGFCRPVQCDLLPVFFQKLFAVPGLTIGIIHRSCFGVVDDVRPQDGNLRHALLCGLDGIA